MYAFSIICFCKQCYSDAETSPKREWISDKNNTLACSYCRVYFENVNQQREHYKLDWHRYNLRQSLVQKQPISEGEFDEKTTKGVKNPTQSNAHSSRMLLPFRWPFKHLRFGFWRRRYSRHLRHGPRKNILAKWPRKSIFNVRLFIVWQKSEW
jgi:hypothetical protein